MKTTLAEWPLSDAEDLRLAICDAEDIVNGEDLAETNIIDVVADAATSIRKATLVRNKLTDGSHTYDLVLS